MDEINMDVNESRKILFEEATADEDLRSGFQSYWAVINIVFQDYINFNI